MAVITIKKNKKNTFISRNLSSLVSGINDVAIYEMEQFKQRGHYGRYYYVIKMGKINNFFCSDNLN